MLDKSKFLSLSTSARSLVVTTLGIVMGWSSIATATPMSYTEIFEENLSVNAGQSAIFNFDLGNIGGNSLVMDGASIVSSIFQPTTDETSFDGSHTVTSGLLSFLIGGNDGGRFAPEETIEIKITGENGTGATIFNETVFLGIDTFSFNLSGSQLNWLSDGKLSTVAIAVDSPDFDNDFEILQASLTVEAEHVTTSVPEPATLALLGLGLPALIFYRRRHLQKVK